MNRQNQLWKSAHKMASKRHLRKSGSSYQLEGMDPAEALRMAAEKARKMLVCWCTSEYSGEGSTSLVTSIQS